MIAMRHSVAGPAAGLPYIMPDGSSWWDTGFVAGAGCEYRVDAMWLAFPRQSERPVLGGSIYTNGYANPVTFNYDARKRDCLTSQWGTQECFCYDVGDFLNVRSAIVARHKMSGSTVSIGFEGGTATSRNVSGDLSSNDTLYLCGSHYKGAGWYPMPMDTVHLYGVKMYRNGTLEVSLVPAKKNGRPCFYDEVGRVYRYSLGSTDGVYGMEKTAILNGGGHKCTNYTQLCLPRFSRFWKEAA